jgi:hypothetical protein
MLFAAEEKQGLGPLPVECLLDSVTFWQDGLGRHGATHIRLETKLKININVEK